MSAVQNFDTQKNYVLQIINDAIGFMQGQTGDDEKRASIIDFWSKVKDAIVSGGLEIIKEAKGVYSHLILATQLLERAKTTAMLLSDSAKELIYWTAQPDSEDPENPKKGMIAKFSTQLAEQLADAKDIASQVAELAEKLKV